MPRARKLTPITGGEIRSNLDVLVKATVGLINLINQRYEELKPEEDEAGEIRFNDTAFGDIVLAKLELGRFQTHLNNRIVEPFTKATWNPAAIRQQTFDDEAERKTRTTEPTSEEIEMDHDERVAREKVAMTPAQIEAARRLEAEETDAKCLNCGGPFLASKLVGGLCPGCLESDGVPDDAPPETLT